MINVDSILEMLAPLKNVWCYDELVSRIPNCKKEEVLTMTDALLMGEAEQMPAMIDTIFNARNVPEGIITGYDVWVFLLEDGTTLSHFINPYDVSHEPGINIMKFDTTRIPDTLISGYRIETGWNDIFNYIEGMRFTHYVKKEI